jgi:hypothetical protein
MKRCISSSRRLAAAFIAVSALTISGGVFAQTVDQSGFGFDDFRRRFRPDRRSDLAG